MRIWAGITGSFLTLDLGSGIEKFGSGINIPDSKHWFRPNIIYDVSYSSGKIMAVLQIQSILIR
jgi:hypothetical protein